MRIVGSRYEDGKFLFIYVQIHVLEAKIIVFKNKNIVKRWNFLLPKRSTFIIKYIKEQMYFMNEYYFVRSSMASLINIGLCLSRHYVLYIR